MNCLNCQGTKWVTECPYCNEPFCVNCFDNGKCSVLKERLRKDRYEFLVRTFPTGMKLARKKI